MYKKEIYKVIEACENAIKFGKDHPSVTMNKLSLELMEMQKKQKK
jgi:hypothetical protein